MPSCAKCSPPVPASPAVLPAPSPLNLDAYSEATRRRLYDLTVVIHFQPPEVLEDEEQFVSPRYTAEEAGLLVWWIFGRWFAVFQPLEDLAQPYLPPDRRWVVLRITAAPETPFGVAFHEV